MSTREEMTISRGDVGTLRITDSGQYNGIAAGVYDMQCGEADLGFTAGTEQEPAKPQVALLMEFVDGPYKGQTLTWYGFFTEKTKASTIRSLRLLGWKGDDLQDLSTVRGKAPCTIQVEADLEGTPRPRIRFIGGGALALKNTMTPEQKAAFAASMKAFAASIGPASTDVKEVAKEAPKKFF